MIEGDAGDHRDVGINDVGSVETPAEPDLKDHHIQLRLLKQPQRRERAVFKIGQRDVTPRRFDFSKRSRMRRLRQFSPLNAHAFGVAHQMRRAVDPHFITGRHQDGFQRAAGGAFAIGARDGKNERRRFNDIHLPGDLADARQPKVDGFTVQMFQIRKPRSQGRRGLRNRIFFHDARKN